MVEPSRVVAIQHEGGYGSGYVIGPTLVLTSAHCTPAVGQRVSLVVLAHGMTYRGRVVWRGTPGGRDDAALVGVDDPAWRAAEGEVDLGRLVTSRGMLPCEAWGFVARLQRDRPDTVHLVGTVNVGSRYAADRYVVDLVGHPPEAESPWAGLSGAAMFCDGLLTGVVVLDQGGSGHMVVEAVPLYVLQQDRLFRETLIVQGRSGVDVRPVELDSIAERILPARTPASLLVARRGVVPFRGRGDLMDYLKSWAGYSGFAALLVHGPGGQGKTRVAQELDRLLAAKRWAILWLDSAAADVAVIRDISVPLLIVVDYAESRINQVGAVLRTCTRRPENPPTKLLLLARTAGDWWKDLTGTGPSASDLMVGSPAVELGPLHTDDHDRLDAYCRALMSYSYALPRSLDHPVPAFTLSKDLRHFRQPGPALSLHMTALADLLVASSEEGTADTAVENTLLRHERRYWRRTADQRRLEQFDNETLSDTLAVAMLAGAESTEEADALLAGMPALADQKQDTRDKIRRWIAHLYPAPRPWAWGSLLPDLLAEYFITERILQNGVAHLLDPVVGALSVAQREHLLIVLARVAGREAARPLQQELTDLIARHPCSLALGAIAAAPQAEFSRPLIDGLSAISTDPDADIRLLAEMAEALPETGTSLASWAADLQMRLVAQHRQQGDAESAEASVVLADSLGVLAARLSKAGRFDEALSSAQEAVAIYRAGVESGSASMLPRLASALGNLAIYLEQFGHPAAAVALIKESVSILRGGEDVPSPDHLDKLAAAWQTLAICLSRLGERGEALAAIRETVRFYRARAESAEFAGADLAVALTNYAVVLSELRRSNEALDAAQEATAIFRRLSAAQPDRFRAAYATALHNLSAELSAAGRKREALASIQEAVRVRRALAAVLPGAHLSEFADSLSSLAVSLGADDAAGCCAAIDEAVALYRRITAETPGRHEDRLARTLNIAYTIYSAVDRPGEAFALIEEAVSITDRLVRDGNTALCDSLASLLVNYSVALSVAGQTESAITAATRSMELRQQLAQSHPEAFRPEVARSARALSNRLREAGRADTAFELIVGVVKYQRTLADADPHLHLEDLATSYRSLSLTLIAQGKWEDALGMADEELRARSDLVGRGDGPRRISLVDCLVHRLGILQQLDRGQDQLLTLQRIVFLYSRMADWEDARHRAGLTMYLTDLFIILLDHAPDEESLARIDEACTVLRRHKGSASTELADLANTMTNAAGTLSKALQWQKAFQYAEEAVGLYERIAADDPETYGPQVERVRRISAWIHRQREDADER